MAGVFIFIVSRQALEETTATRVPRALAAMELLRHSERFVASGPALLNAATADEIGNEIAAKNAELASIRRLLTDLRGTDNLTPMVMEIEVTIDNLVGNLDDIGTAATQKNQAISYRTALLHNAYGAARAFAKIWSARFAAVQKQVGELERSAAQKADPQRLDEIDQAMLAMLPLDQLQRRAADSFQTLVGAAETEDPSELARLKTSSEDALRDIEGLVSGVDLDTATALFPQLKQLGDASLGSGGLFAVKQSELKATADGRRLIEENRRLANRLSDAVQAFVTVSRGQMQASARGAVETQTTGGLALGAIALLSLISSVLIVWLYVGRNILRRLSGVSAGVAAIAAGRRDVVVDQRGADEVAAMGRAVEVLRQNAVERDALLIERAGATERLEQQVEERTAELRDALNQQLATAEVLQVINNSPGNMTPVFETVLKKAAQLCDVDSGILWVYDGTRFHAAALHAVPQAYEDYVRDPVEAPVFADLRDGRDVVHVPDLVDSDLYRAGDPLRRAVVDLRRARTGLNIAIRKNEELLGVINVCRDQVRPFSQAQIDRLTGLAAQAAIAVENARLITETREALDQQTAAAEVLQVINASPSDLAPVFDAVLANAMRLCDAAFGMMRSYDGERLKTIAALGLPDAYAQFLRDNPQSPAAGTVVALLVQGAPFYHAADAAGEFSRREAGLASPR